MYPLKISSCDSQDIERCFFWDYFHKYFYINILRMKYPPFLTSLKLFAIIVLRNIFCYQGIPEACWLPVMEMVPMFVPERDPEESVMQMKIWQLSHYQCNYTAGLMWEEKLCLLWFLWFSNCSLLLSLHPPTSDGWAGPCFSIQVHCSKVKC